MQFTTEHRSTFQVKLSDFEGPLDLLLSLVEKRKLFINEISLAQVSDDYIATIQEEDTFPVSDVSGFLLVASTLVLIKSKSLLPELPLTEDEEGDVENLEKRLHEYKIIRELSSHVKEHYGQNVIYFPRKKMEKTVMFSPDEKTTIPHLLEAMQNVFEKAPEEVEAPKAEVKKIIRVEDMMERLFDRVSSSLRASFHEFSGRGEKEKSEVIVSFVAVLELVKNGAISVEQQENFADIEMEPLEFDIPTYN